MKQSILLCLLLSFGSMASAQIPEPVMLWLKGIGGNGSDILLTPVIKTSDGGFIISYQTTSTIGPIDTLCSISNPEIIFQKYNSDASILDWSKCYGAGGDSFLIYMFSQNDGGYVLGGEYGPGLGWGYYICKQDALGNILWSHSYSKGNSPLLYDMIATSDGGYMMIGDVYYTDTNFTVHNSGSLYADIGVLKLDSLGNKIWSKAIGGSNDDNGNKVIEALGGYYIVGNTESFDSDCTGKHLNYDTYLARLDLNGNILWHHDLGGDGADDGNYACPDGRGGIIIGGTTSSSNGDVHHHIGGYDYWVLDVDSSNTIVWENCYGGHGDEHVNSVCKATDGSIWVAGYSEQKGGEVDTAYGNDDAWIVHADTAGNFINATVLGSDQADRGMMVYPLSNNSVITGGYYSDSGGAFSINYYGGGDVFLSIFEPWTSGIKQVTPVKNILQIFPNPANEKVIIEPQQRGSYLVVIADVIGRIIYKADITGNVQITVSEWPRGLYYVEMINEKGYRVVQKLIVQ